MNTLTVTNNQDIRELTPANLSRTLEELLPNEELVFTRKADGTFTVCIRVLNSDKRSTVQLTNRLFARLNPVPVKAGWMGSTEIRDAGRKQVLDAMHHKARTAKVAVRVKEKNSQSVKDMLDIMLFSIDTETTVPEPVTGKLQNFLSWKVGRYEIWTTESMQPVYYKVDDGELTRV